MFSPRSFRIALSGLLLAIASFPLTSRAGTIVLPSAYSGIGWNCTANGNAKGQSAQGVPAEASGACDVSGASAYGASMAAGTAHTFFGDTPSANVSASATQTDITTNVSLASIDMLAEVVYNIALVENGAPPSSPDFVPVTETWTGETTPNTFQSGAWACVEFGPSGWDCRSTGSTSLLLAPAVAYSVGIKAECYAASIGDGTEALNASCQAIIDPVFTFDQAAFDAEMGSNTFKLADYYSFAYSPNLNTGSGSSVPEPATLSLLGLGLAGVGFMTRRKAA